MTHRELVQKAREDGLTQCKGASWRDAQGNKLNPYSDSLHSDHSCRVVDHVAACCEYGLLRWGYSKGYLSEENYIQLYHQIVRYTGVSISVLNDEGGMTWDQFTDLIER